MTNNSPPKNLPISVLLIDDDRKFCKLIQEYLQPLGFSVHYVHTGPAGAEKAMGGRWSAILLDVMLPGMSGFEVLKKIRTKSNVPVLMLTARGSETDRIDGLETGADDYLPKTFSPRELLARLRAVIRRSALPAPKAIKKPSKIKTGPLVIDMNTRTVELDDQRLDLTPVE
jgi:DNA-binding response OmpR family regulator